jgi:hypothetical protein
LRIAPPRDQARAIHLPELEEKYNAEKPVAIGSAWHYSGAALKDFLLATGRVLRTPSPPAWS